ncbi:PREDICTED: uncharacterized protein LOC109132610 [Camelina sativa]|uniref:Uncharacterized protein LOC109132610 n=1 Tax=Camelina sativa TaxID=90675 RepID=A0ABM1RLM7_CAMSA|nr:PREDICTED: uncharacterized protein LOC109132610 [Camelina sativa]
MLLQTTMVRIMDLDTQNLIDQYNLADEERLADEDMPPKTLGEIETLPQEAASSRTKQGTSSSNHYSRRHAKCWKNFTLGKKYVDGPKAGKHDVTCKHCKRNYCLNLSRNGTNTMNRHMRSCSKTPGSTPSINKKLDMMVFREKIAMALIQHNLPYSFVEYEKIREAFTYLIIL